MKKKKSKSMYLVLTLLLLLVAGFTTYAIYKTSARGTANVSAANWIVKVTADSTTTNVTGGNNNIALGACATHLAPGGSCTVPFTVDMTDSEVDSIVSVEVGTGIAQETLDLMDDAGITLKISDGITEGYSYVLPYGTTKVLNLVIDWEAGEETDDEKASADVAISKIVGGLTIPVNMIVKQYNGGGESPAPTYTSYTLGDDVYFDPVSNQTTCTENEFSESNVVNGTSNCMKWRVMTVGDDASNSTITLQLDHNLVNKVAWNTSGSNNDGPVTVLQSLANATSTWANVETLNYTYDTTTSAENYGVLSCTNGVCNITKNNATTTITGTTGENAIPPLKARLITGEEVAAITKTQNSDETTIAANWTLANQTTFYFSRDNKVIGTKTTGEGNTNLKWLIENTYPSTSPSGATAYAYDSGNYGYWSLSPYRSNTSYSYYVNYDGDFYIGIVDSDSLYGARPVITIPKSKIQ